MCLCCTCLSVKALLIMYFAAVYTSTRYMDPYPKAPETHILSFLGSKTILCKAFGLFWALGLGFVAIVDGNRLCSKGNPARPQHQIPIGFRA